MLAKTHLTDAMHSLAQEIQGFSKTKLKKQRTVVTTVLGRRHIETMDDSNMHENEDQGMSGCGFVQDTSLDLHVGIIRPFLLLCKASSLVISIKLSRDILLLSTLRKFAYKIDATIIFYRAFPFNCLV